MTRQSDTLEARRAADDFATERGLPPAGGYSGSWYRDGYLAGWWPDWASWWANYSEAAGALLGGQIVAHQWSSTPIDQSVFLESEIVQVGGNVVTDPEREQMQAQINGLVTTVADIADRIGDEILTEAKRPAGVRRTELRRIVSEMQSERVVAVGPRP